MKKTEEDFQQMIQERLRKVEEIKNCLKLSGVSRNGNVNSCCIVCRPFCFKSAGDLEISSGILFKLKPLQGLWCSVNSLSSIILI